MRMPKKRCIAVMALAIGGTAGCGTRGELRTGTFTYECVDKSDVACVFLGSASLPALMAKGSRARVNFSDGNDNSFQVLPAAPRLASLENGNIVFHEPGVVALIAQRGPDQVGDFVNVSIAVLDHLALTSEVVGAPAGMLPGTVPNGQQATVTAAPIGPSGQSLAGALAYTWTSSDQTIATVTTPTSPDHKVTVTGKAPGTATIQASAGGATGDIVITVQ